MRTRQQTELYIKMKIFEWVLREHTNSFIVQKTEDSAQGGQTFISIQSGTVVLKTSHLTFLICAFKKKKKRGGGNMEMFDKLLSGQKQKRDGGGRCWWQVYYATEATGEANNWEMELSQHFAESTTPKGVTLSLVKTRQNYSLRHLESVSQAMPVLCICDKIEKLICSVYYLVTDPCGNP